MTDQQLPGIARPERGASSGEEPVAARDISNHEARTIAAVVDWIYSPTRKPAHLAFTAGMARQIATLCEMAVAQAHRSAGEPAAHIRNQAAELEMLRGK